MLNRWLWLTFSLPLPPTVPTQLPIMLLTSLLPIGLFSVATTASYVSSLPENAQTLFNESMVWMDSFNDREYGALYQVDSTSALRHGTRSSAWYAVGLLARNEGRDVEDALKMIVNVIKGQFKNPKDNWYGTYQKYFEEPTVGSKSYPEKRYNSWDPNWRGFVGTTFIVALEEFGHLIPENVTTLIEESLFNATVGDSYRVGGVDGDNLYPSYSNPALMRAFVSAYVGNRLNDSNMTAAGYLYAQDSLALFNKTNTLSEFNSGTYTGVSLFALTLWAKYLPADNIMTGNGRRIISETWKAVAQLWHPDLKNVAGPWDRSYGFDMNRYVSILGLHFWALIGKKEAGFSVPAQILSHSGDFAIAPLVAILAPFHASLMPAEIMGSLTTFSGEHTFVSQTYSPPYDYVPRNITSWLTTDLTIGAETFNQTVVGGPAINTKTFNPAVIQWQTGTEVGYITLFPSEKALIADVAPGVLNLTYPAGTSKSAFSLLVGAFKNKVDVATWEDLIGLKVKPSGNVDPAYTVAFAGSNGGTFGTINDFEFWNFTYVMPANSTSVPNLLLEVSLI